VIPRLLAAEANLNRIKFLDRKSFRTIAGDNEPQKRPLDLTQDLGTLLKLLKKPENKGYKMIIVDPVTGVFGGKNMGKNDEIDPVLRELLDFCEEANIAFVGVMHTPKLMTNSAIDKIPGGSSVRGSAKSVFMLSRNTDSDDKHDHLMTMIKWNYTGNSDGQEFKTVGAEIEHKGNKLKTATLAWGEITSMVGDDVLVKQNEKKESRDRQGEKCEMFLLAFLENGPVRSPKVYDAALAAGNFSKDTVQKALKRIGGDHIDRRSKHEGFWMTLTPKNTFPEVIVEEQLIADVAVL
jgi:hypothetical protein